jgi:hypothetical protein
MSAGAGTMAGSPVSCRVMDISRPRFLTLLSWAGAAVFGVLVGCGGYLLTVWARYYCLAGDVAGGRLELNLLFPLMLAAEVAAATAALFTGRALVLRAPSAVRVVTPFLLVVVVTVLFAWWVFATRGTLDGYPGYPGPCPASNIPPQWPDWIPA